MSLGFFHLRLSGALLSCDLFAMLHIDLPWCSSLLLDFSVSKIMSQTHLYSLLITYSGAFCHSSTKQARSVLTKLSGIPPNSWVFLGFHGLGQFVVDRPVQRCRHWGFCSLSLTKFHCISVCLHYTSKILSSSISFLCSHLIKSFYFFISHCFSRKSVELGRGNIKIFRLCFVDLVVFKTCPNLWTERPCSSMEWLFLLSL